MADGGLSFMRQCFSKMYAAVGAVASLLLIGPTVAEDGVAGQAEDGVAGQAEPIPSVKVVRAELAAPYRTRSFFGVVRARETVDLSFEVGGAMDVLTAIEGDRVERGRLLAQLDQARFERAVERAEVTLRQATRDYQRAAALMQRSAASRARYEDAETVRDLASVALREARDDLEDATILAPFDGLVAERLTPNFTNVEPGHPILRLHDMSEVRVELELPERLLTRVGDPSRVRFTTRMPDRDDDIVLRFVEFHAETDRVGQSYTITLAFPDVDSAFLVPGASVTVTAAVPSELTGLVLPASAILSGADRETAVLVLEPGEGPSAVLRRLPVEVRSETGTGFLVTGVRDGAEVVAVGGHLLREGQTVRRYSRLVVEER